MNNVLEITFKKAKTSYYKRIIILILFTIMMTLLVHVATDIHQISRIIAHIINVVMFFFVFLIIRDVYRHERLIAKNMEHREEMIKDILHYLKSHY